MVVFSFWPVIGVGIVALNHYRLQYHHSVIYSNYISMLYGLMAESINPEMCVIIYKKGNGACRYPYRLEKSGAGGSGY